MSNDEFLGDRKRALEDAFFAKQEKAAMEKVRAELDRKATRAELAATTGITDDKVLDEICGLGVTTHTLTALALAPLVRVAWADGEVQAGEREAILASAAKRGIAAGGAAHTLLLGWLESKPDAGLDRAWADYTRALCDQLDAPQRAALRDQVLGFARGVAEAAGGFLGVKTISREEEAALTAIAEAFR
jgi:hypothetical protein